MNILKLSAKIKTEINSRKNKQGVIADTIAQAFGYKSHHALTGDIKLISIEESQSTDRTIDLVRAMENSYSIDEIVFDGDITQTSGDLFFDYYMKLATNEMELLHQLAIHQGLLQQLVNRVDTLGDRRTESADSLKAMTNNLPENIMEALHVEMDEADYPRMVFSSYLEDVMNMREAITNLIIKNPLKIY